LELGLSRSREQEPFVIHVSNLLDKAGFEYTVRMNKDFQRKIKRKSKMSLLKTVKMQAAVVLTALALTARSSTSAPSATEIKVVEKAVMPTPPAALMVAPVRPNPPKDGKTATLLEHAAEFGGYVAELENQNQAWRDWVNSQAEVDGSEGAR